MIARLGQLAACLMILAACTSPTSVDPRLSEGDEGWEEKCLVYVFAGDVRGSPAEVAELDMTPTQRLICTTPYVVTITIGVVR